MWIEKSECKLNPLMKNLSDRQKVRQVYKHNMLKISSWFSDEAKESVGNRKAIYHKGERRK